MNPNQLPSLSLVQLANSAFDDPILDIGDYKPGRLTLADEARFTATRFAGKSQFPLAIANCKRAGGKTADGIPFDAPELTLANEERFTAAYYSEPLTQYATGWTDSENLQEILDFVAPRVPVGRRFEYKAANNAEAFYSEQDDDRAINAEFKRVEYQGSSQNSKTFNRGLTYRLDLDEEGMGILTEELIVARILQRLRRNQLRRAITALIAASTNTAKTWSDGTSKNPNEDVRTALLAGQADAGVFPNRLLFDLQAWAYRGSGLAGQLTAGSLAAYSQDPQDVADFLGMQEAKLSRAVYQSTATAKTRITANRVFLFIGQDAPSRDDPTNLKHFVTPVGDGDFRVYRQPVGAKFVDITVEYYDNVVATTTKGAQMLTIS